MARIVTSQNNQITAPTAGPANFNTIGQAPDIAAQQTSPQGMASGDASGAKAIASNPANGISNVPLQGGEGAPQGVTPEEITKALNMVGNSPPEEASKYTKSIEDIFTRVQDPQVKQKLQKLVNALTMTNDPKRQTIDPATGKPDPTASEMAKKMSEEITQMMQAQKQVKPEPTQQSTQQSTQQPAVTSKVLAFNWREAQAKQKKKKGRGNPFRVLMGKVGKLLEAGVSKSDIIRYLKKTMDYFNDETIARCVDVVRDYNKKKFHAESKSAPKRDDGEGDKPKVEENALPMPANPRANFAQTFNWTRYAEAKTETIYDATPNWEKRSTPELLSRLHTLTRSSKEAMRGEFPAAITVPGSGSEAKLIRAALKLRDFGDDEINESIGENSNLQGKFKSQRN